jgi:phosphopentomutase
MSKTSLQAVLIVIDSFGIGSAPDAEEYGDEGANTAVHIAESVGGARWPTLKRYGLGNAAALLGKEMPGCEPVDEPTAIFGVMAQKSPGKDTTTGHWELAGIELDRPFGTFPPEPPSFPEELVSKFEAETGRKILGNKAASGTVIIEELGREHIRTGNPICYTSADSVFQIAAHEEVIPPEELYRMCETARRLCDAYYVARIIARPFVGEPGSFTRTSGRRDFSLPLPGPSILDHLQVCGVITAGVGKIGDIFNEQGLTVSHHDKGNEACIDRVESLLAEESGGPRFVFVNLVDTDMIYGHRRDPKGYHDSVMQTDMRLNEILKLLGEGDLLIVTADHGCDPTFEGTDHTREFVPLLAVRKGQQGGSLGIRHGLSDVAAGLAVFFGCPEYPRGTSPF